MDPKEAIQLLERYRKGESTEAEKALVEQWYEQLNETGDFQWNGGERMSMEQMIHSRLMEQIHGIQKPGSEAGKVRRMRPWKWIAAACILLVTGYVLWVTVGRRSQDAGDKTQVANTHDVPAPKDTRAVITLADGRKVYLDSVNNGTIAQENNVDVVKNENGEIIYSHKGAKAQSEIVYNTLSNPRGSKVISLTLSDGTKVWLNSESSLKYPIAFAGNSREVEITGEAYFEVAHDASKPFHVTKGETDITVLGTHFNVNAYDDEESLKVTLLEGSVKVSAANKSVTIKPGEQAQMNGGNAIGLVVNRGVDVDQVMAWKNGLFDFDGADLQTIMRQIARWYDVEVIYQGNVTKEAFKGEINRTVPVSKVLQMLEYLGMKFSVEGKKVVVLK